MSQITQGTVAVTNGSQIVTGTSTNFVSAGADNGDLFIVSGDNVAYAIGSVDSDTQITLAANYAGASNASTAYAITVDFTPNFGLPLPQTGDIGVSAQLRDGFNEIDTQLLNTVGVTTLDGLTDTDLTGLNLNDILVYNSVSSKWEPQSQSTGSGLFNIIEDTSPQLGGTLDVNGHSIVSTSNGNILINPNGTGVIILDGNELPSVTGTNGQVLTTNGAGITSWTTTNLVGLIDEENGMIEAPNNKTYTTVLNAKYARDIEEITTQTSTGTLTVAVQIDGVSVTGLSAISVTSTEATTIATALNDVALGKSITLVVSGISNPFDFTFSIKTTRT